MAQTTRKIEHLHGPSHGAIHLNICDHASADSTAALGFRKSCGSSTQSIHLVDALLAFEMPYFLSLAHVPSKVPVACRLRQRHPPRHFGDGAALFNAIALADMVFVSFGQYRKEVIGLYICVAPCKSDAETGNSAVQPLIVPSQQHRPNGIARAAASQILSLGNTWAHQDGFCSVPCVHPACPRSTVLAFFRFAFRLACVGDDAHELPLLSYSPLGRTAGVWHLSFNAPQRMHVVLASHLEVLQGSAETAFVYLRIRVQCGTTMVTLCRCVTW